MGISPEKAAESLRRKSEDSRKSKGFNFMKDFFLKMSQ
jgi:hypothetical protein